MSVEVYMTHDGHILRKTDKWRQMYIQKSSTFYTPDDMCLQNNILRREIIRIFLCKSVEAHMSAST